MLFSRYLSSLDWRPVGVRPKAALRALVVVANPGDLAAYRPGGRELAPIPVEAELARIRTALDPIRPTELATSGGATLDGLVDRLHDGYHVLVLVCHGYMAQGEPLLLLEPVLGDHAGAVTAVAFAPDGRILATGGEDHKVVLWDLAQLDALRDAAVGLACSITGGLDRGDWSRYVSEVPYERTCSGRP